MNEPCGIEYLQLAILEAIWCPSYGLSTPDGEDPALIETI